MEKYGPTNCNLLLGSGSSGSPSSNTIGGRQQRFRRRTRQTREAPECEANLIDSLFV